MSKDHHLQRVRVRAHQAVDEVYAELQQIPWAQPEAYASWLAQTYYFVRHATRLLAHAAARCALEDEVLHQSFLKGISEEKDHEQLALNDLRMLGSSIERHPEFPETAAYHQTLYYAIDHSGPAALIGYFLPLEGVAAKCIAPNLAEITRYHPARGCSFLRVHCQADQSHFDEALTSLEGLRSDQLHAVLQALEISVPLYRAIAARIHGAHTMRLQATRTSA